MIHTKELRFGNKIQTQYGEVITVQQIGCDSVIYGTKIEVKKGKMNITEPPDESAYLFELNEVVKEAACEEIFPIALTPEILKKCGFRNFCREEWIISIGNSHVDFVFVDGILRLRSLATSLTNIKYVHQLQNFIFAISEHDLDVELSEEGE
jgi:hypothetical protein